MTITEVPMSFGDRPLGAGAEKTKMGIFVRYQNFDLVVGNVLIISD